MDFLKKNIFWIGSFLLAATAIGVWFYATGALQAATASRESEINGLDGKVNGVQNSEAEEGTKAHPNQETEKGMNEKIDKLADSVVRAWQLRYDAQRDTMKWPEDILTQGFMTAFNKYDPPETLPADETGQSNEMKTLLRLYQQQIPSQMKNICSIIKTDWIHQEQLDREAFRGTDKADEAADAPEGDGEAAASDDEDDEDRSATGFPEESKEREIVQWSELNQGLWLQKLTNFRNRDDNQFETRIPSPSQVYMLQQDLWLLEAMFEIIRVVNAQKDSDGNPITGDDGKPVMVLANDLAAVKKIDHVVFGREALGLLGEIMDVAGSESQSLVRGGSGRGGSGRGGTQTNDTGFEYYGKPAFHGRYVDSTLEPIKSEDIQKVFGETNLPADSLELVVAKRVPVRLAVQMDEREIPNFLAACANSPFAFEVWQVRVNKHDPEEAIALRGGSGDSGRPNYGITSGGQAGGLGGDSPGAIAGTDQVALRKDHDVGVEFYGIVKIYNPVNAELITGKKSEEATSTP